MILTISVLYVDDELPLLEIGKSYLEDTNEFAVTTAASADLALDRIKSNGIQAIVSDYEMPGMDGIEFLKQIRTRDKTIPFILFTGKGREEVAVKAFENGADFYLQKGGAPTPQFTELMQKIKAAVEHRRADVQVATLNRLYTVLSGTNKAIVHIHNTSELLNEICRIVVDDGGFAMAWAGLVNDKTHLIEPTAASGHVDKILDAISISTDDIPSGRGPTGTAFRRRTFNVCNDIEHDPTMVSWRKAALGRGFRSVAAFPFALNTGNAGVITFFASEPGFFNDRIVRLLDEQSGDISFALQTIEHEEQRVAAEKKLKKSELQYRRLFETAQDAILILDGDTGEIIDANPFILDMLGYPLDYFMGRHLWELGFLKDKSFAQNAFTKLKTEGYIRYDDLPLETQQGKAMHVEFVSNVYLVGEKRIIQCNIRDITDRKEALSRSEVSESRYRRLFETAQDGILILDGESGDIFDANPFILNLLGYPLEYFVGKHLWELGFLKDKIFAKNAFTELKAEGYIRYDDLPLETQQGNAISVEFISNVYLVDGKKIIQCNIRETTDRKKAQDALQVSEARYRRLFETAQDGILILEGDTGEIIDANKFILDMLGYPLDYFMGKHLWELGFLKDKSLAQTAFTKLKTEGYIRYDDLPLETQQGKDISVEFISNVYLVDGKKIIQCNIRETTDRKKAQDALQVSEARYRRLFETAQDGILILDGDTREIIDANPFILDLLGYPLDYFMGKHLWELGFLQDKSFAKNAFEKLNTEGYIRYDDLPLETKQGKAMHVEFVSNVYLVGDKRIIQCNIRDITDRKRTDDALALASRKLKLMSGITRHDILNQVTVLSGSLELALKTTKEPERFAHMDRARKAADTIQRQIAFTREYEDLGVMTPAWQRLSVIVRSAASQMATSSIAFEIPDDLLEIYADPLLIRVFYNLFDNARQHGGSVNQIRISYQQIGTGLIITVADNGIGITSEDKQHLFERGFGKHTGLGLFLSREILSITGITISETGIPGEGARFEIAVPAGAFRSMEKPAQS